MIPLFLDNGPLKVQVPSLIEHVITSGTSVAGQSIIESFATGGFPPYIYSWTDNVSAVSVVGAASASATMRYVATGTQDIHNGIFVLSVTDMAGKVVAGSTQFEITQGTPP